jgi:hypothetical protein
MAAPPRILWLRVKTQQFYSDPIDVAHYLTCTDFFQFTIVYSGNKNDTGCHCAASRSQTNQWSLTRLIAIDDRHEIANMLNHRVTAGTAGRPVKESAN